MKAGRQGEAPRQPLGGECGAIQDGKSGGVVLPSSESYTLNACAKKVLPARLLDGTRNRNVVQTVVSDCHVTAQLTNGKSRLSGCVNSYVGKSAISEQAYNMTLVLYKSTFLKSLVLLA